MSGLASVVSSLEPVHFLYALVVIFFWHAIKSAAAGNAGIWKILATGVASGYRELMVYPDGYFQETATYFRKEARIVHVQWFCMKAASYTFATAFCFFVYLTFYSFFSSNPDPWLPMIAPLSIVGPAVFFRICRVEGARLEIRKKELERKMAEAEVRESRP